MVSECKLLLSFCFSYCFGYKLAANKLLIDSNLLDPPLFLNICPLSWVPGAFSVFLLYDIHLYHSRQLIRHYIFFSWLIFRLQAILIQKLFPLGNSREDSLNFPTHSNGRWSVCTLNLRPNTYDLMCSIAHTIPNNSRSRAL